MDLHDDLLSNMPKLKIFLADSNLIEELRHQLFRNNKNIEEIYLGRNEILEIDVRFTAFKELRVVDLKENLGDCDFMLRIYRSDRKPLRRSKLNRFQMNVNEHCTLGDFRL